jgi:FkbM family methyltransferase
MYHLPWTRVRLIPASQPSVGWDMTSYKNGERIDFKNFSPPPPLEIFTETGMQIDTAKTEYPEQCLAFSYIDSDSTVLELGARYGSVSCIINKKLTNKSNQVSVEPDETVWTALEENIRRNNCEITLHKGFVSRKPLNLLPYGYAATSVPASSSNIQSLTVEELEGLHHLKFDTLVADCEGFLGEFFDENPHLYNQLMTVIFEADYPQKCNYDNLRQSLKDNGFCEIISGFQNVFKK